MDQPAKIVEEYLKLHMIPDPDAARRYCAPELEIRFTGNRLMRDPAEATAFNRARYKWVKKKFLFVKHAIENTPSPICEGNGGEIIQGR